MQTIGPAAARHHAPGELVDDDDFAIFDYIIDVALVNGMGLDCGLHVVFQRPVFLVGNVFDS